MPLPSLQAGYAKLLYSQELSFYSFRLIAISEDLAREGLMADL